MVKCYLIAASSCFWASENLMTFFSVIFEDGVLTTLAVCYLPCSANMMSITRLKTDSPPQVCPQAYRASQKKWCFLWSLSGSERLCKSIWSYHVNYASLFILDKVQLNPGMEDWNFLWVLFVTARLRYIYEIEKMAGSDLPWYCFGYHKYQDNGNPGGLR